MFNLRHTQLIYKGYLFLTVHRVLSPMLLDSEYQHHSGHVKICCPMCSFKNPNINAKNICGYIMILVKQL